MEGNFDMFGFVAGALTGLAVASVAVYFISRNKSKQVENLKSDMHSYVNHSIRNEQNAIEAEKELNSLKVKYTKLSSDHATIVNRFYNLLMEAWVRNRQGRFTKASEYLTLTTADKKEINLRNANIPATPTKKTNRKKSDKQHHLPM